VIDLLVTDFSTADLRSEVENLRVQVRADLSAELIEVFRAAASEWAGYATLPIADGRGGSVIVAPAVGQPRLLVRRCLRGGLPAKFVRGTYLGFSPRPFRELRVMKSLYERGAPVAEPYGAAVQWLFPGCYRGWLATRFIEGSCTLWKWLRDQTPPPAERRAVLEEVGQSIRKVRSLGVWHADLNLHNILIVPAAAQRVVLIDFDRANEATDENISAELKRLRRSAHKLDPQGKIITEQDLSLLKP